MKSDVAKEWMYKRREKNIDCTVHTLEEAGHQLILENSHGFGKLMAKIIANSQKYNIKHDNNEEDDENSNNNWNNETIMEIIQDVDQQNTL